MADLSRPPTPSAELPTVRSEWRFEDMTAPTEDIEHYRPGGFHPLHPRDQLREGRYVMVRKLGYGCFSTVWLAQDIQLSKLVAIKVAKANAYGLLDELELYRMLSRSNSDSMNHIVMPIDHFVQTGPNGEHHRLVFEPMGPNSNRVMEDSFDTSSVYDESAESDESLTQEPHTTSPGDEPLSAEESEVPPCPPLLDMFSGPPHTWPRPPPTPVCLTLSQRKTLIKQLLLGLHCLHSSKIAHGDLSPGNLLFCTEPFSTQDVESILKSDNEIGKSAPVCRIDGKQDLWAPRHLYDELPLTDNIDMNQPIRAKISDLGAAFTFDNPPTADKCGTPVALRAPEIVLEGIIGPENDIWAFGCLIFEFLTGRRVFDLWLGFSTTPEMVQDEHLLQMVDKLGKPPSEFLAKWTRCSRYFDADTKLIRSDVGPSEVPECEVYQYPSLEDAFAEAMPEGMKADEVAQVLTLLRSILQYDPKLRPTTSGLLENPWFQSIDPVNEATKAPTLLTSLTRLINPTFRLITSPGIARLWHKVKSKLKSMQNGARSNKVGT